jgi:hypothetical protein
MMKSASELIHEAHRLSGGGKRLSTTRSHGLYSRLTIPPFENEEYVRDTIKRFDDFGFDDSPSALAKETMFDVGSNVGALCWEAWRRGCRNILGMEFNDERIQFCRDVAEFHGMNKSGHVDFRQADFRVSLPKIGKASVVFCCSVDDYFDVDYLPTFYGWLASLVAKGGRCFFESNIQGAKMDTDEIQGLLSSAFGYADHLGCGDSGGISRKRHLFICGKAK